jgi:hypothetical protein
VKRLYDPALLTRYSPELWAAAFALDISSRLRQADDQTAFRVVDEDDFGKLRAIVEKCRRRPVGRVVGPRDEE